MGVRDVFMFQVAPAVGSTLAQCMFLSAVPAIQRCKEKRTLGALNPFPFPFIAGNCAAWMMYGAISANYWVYVPNITGVFIGLYYTTVSYALSERSRQMLERIMGTLILLIAFCGMIMSCSMRNSSESDRLVVAGVLANSILVVYYTSPLSTMFEVFRTRDSKSMHFPLVLCNCLNGVCWTSYGIALDDWWIAAPNLFGSMLSLVQLCMIIVFPSSKQIQRLTPTSSAEGLVDLDTSTTV